MLNGTIHAASNGHAAAAFGILALGSKAGSSTRVIFSSGRVQLFVFAAHEGTSIGATALHSTACTAGIAVQSGRATLSLTEVAEVATRVQSLHKARVVTQSGNSIATTGGVVMYASNPLIIMVGVSSISMEGVTMNGGVIESKSVSKASSTIGFAMNGNSALLSIDGTSRVYMSGWAVDHGRITANAPVPATVGSAQFSTPTSPSLAIMAGCIVDLRLCRDSTSIIHSSSSAHGATLQSNPRNARVHSYNFSSSADDAACIPRVENAFGAGKEVMPMLLSASFFDEEQLPSLCCGEKDTCEVMMNGEKERTLSIPISVSHTTSKMTVTKSIPPQITSSNSRTAPNIRTLIRNSRSSSPTISDTPRTTSVTQQPLQPTPEPTMLNTTVPQSTEEKIPSVRVTLTTVLPGGDAAGDAVMTSAAGTTVVTSTFTGTTSISSVSRASRRRCEC